jgi:hypothetical protein
MTLIVITIGLVLVLIGLVVATAYLFRDYPASELLDWKPTRSPEVEAQNEIDDVQQMIDAQNEYRARRGAKAITEADVHRQAREDEAIRAKGRGQFAQGAGVDDDLGDMRPPKPKRKRKAKARARKPSGKPSKR